MRKYYISEINWLFILIQIGRSPCQQASAIRNLTEFGYQWDGKANVMILDNKLHTLYYMITNDGQNGLLIIYILLD